MNRREPDLRLIKISDMNRGSGKKPTIRQSRKRIIPQPSSHFSYSEINALPLNGQQAVTAISALWLRRSTAFRWLQQPIGRHLMIDVVEQVIERHQEVKNEGISEARDTRSPHLVLCYAVANKSSWPVFVTSELAALSWFVRGLRSSVTGLFVDVPLFDRRDHPSVPTCVL